uniref:Uncharacterized protein n=1 Tax=Setaria digitata TaxID=48799 RepID=A0A915PQ62_9BILA
MQIDPMYYPNYNDCAIDTKATSDSEVVYKVVMINFVIVELPQGVVSVLSSVKGASFAGSESLGDLFDIFSLLNSCVTFSLFCLMNSRIRNAFTQGLFPFSRKRIEQIVHRLKNDSVVVENSNSDNA